MGTRYEAGRYWGRLKAQGMGKSKDKGTPFFAATFEIVGKVDLRDPEGELLACTPGDCTVYMYITEKTGARVIEELALLGYDKPSFRFLDPETPGFTDLAGREVALFCSHEEYNGDMKEKWGIHRERGIGGEPLDQTGYKQLDALFGKQLKSLAPKAGTRTAAPAKANAETVPPSGDVPDDDIPF